MVLSLMCSALHLKLIPGRDSRVGFSWGLNASLSGVKLIPLQSCIWVVVKIMVPFLGTLTNRCRIIIGTQKGAIILTTAHIKPIQIIIKAAVARVFVNKHSFELLNIPSSDWLGSTGKVILQ